MSDAITLENKFSIDRQKACFERGTSYVKLLRAATPNSGIHTYGRDDKIDYINRYEEEAGNLDILKFVPASGAASRMFKKLHQWIEQPKKHSKQINAFFQKVEQYPFFEAWVKVCDELDIETYQAGLESKVNWLKALLDENGLNYSSMPKGTIYFHSYDQEATPIQEHLTEALELSGGNTAKVHFTISPEHEIVFKKAVEEAIEKLGKDSTAFDIVYSFQDKETDTIALDEQGEPLMENGDLVRRPGGHGALIHNLNKLDADLIFVKNIDNVCHKRMLPETLKHKKLLAGVLLDLRVDLMRIHEQITKGLIDEVSIDSARERWGMRIPRDYQKVTEYLKRPIRVCGMVKNQGEPGGGPFWTLDKYTGESLQIVEQSQIDKSNMRQEMILKSATHFNPVDIVCCTKDLSGKPIDLTKYIDEDQYFIANKTHNSTPIKALEWPGLWNGAMANWITVFVEVPISTFNPVKELEDLLRKNHLESA